MMETFYYRLNEEDDYWKSIPFMNAWALAESLAEDDYEDSRKPLYCYEFRVQIADYNKENAKWYSVSADIRFIAMEA